jgi:O-antigen ligase
VRYLVPGDTAASQGTERLWICVVGVLTVAGVQYLLDRAFEDGRLRLPQVDPRTTRMAGAVAGGAVLVALPAGLLSGFLSDWWSDFKEPVEESTVSRLSTVSSSERFLAWNSAFEAAGLESVTGIGPGAFEYWWAREGNGVQFVRDAHSVYFEALAEMGPVGFVLVLALVLGPIVWCVRLALCLDRRAFRVPLLHSAITFFR